jgi:hypothetical protein
MKPIALSEILDLGSYEAVRGPFRARVIEEKKRRRVALGPKASAVFENRDTVLLQIQEMLRTERITRRGAVEHEIETYNELLPTAGELSCTVMIEVPDPAERDAFLVAAAGFEKHVWLTAGSHRILARAADRGGEGAGRTTAVHYLKFGLPEELSDRWCSVGTDAAAAARLAPALEVDHPAYSTRAALHTETTLDLALDLTE